MRFIFFTFCLVVGCSSPEKKTHDTPKSPKETISYHRGYSLWEEQLQYAKVPYDLESVIQGIRAADRGDPLPQQNMASLEKTFREELIEITAKENLLEAELFLQNLAKEVDVFELVPQKLYYKVTQKGEGQPVLESSTPCVDCSSNTLNSEIFFFENLKITLADTIQGFAEGVVGMLPGEERTLFIHPDLAYGNFGGKLEPNSLLIIKVKLRQVG
jgi:peptidylprolyl isomerase